MQWSDWFCMPKRKLLQHIYCQNTASAATAHGAFPKRFIVPNLYAIFTTKSLFLWSNSKGQTISEWICEVIVSPKIRTNNCQDFCPVLWGQISWQFFVRILGETMSSYIHSEINWPLTYEKIRRGICYVFYK